MIFLLLGMIGVGGSYLKNQLFPVYTAASLADAGVLERLDVVFITIWVAGLFIQMSTDAYLFMACLRKVANKKVSRIALPIAASLVAILSITVTIQRFFPIKQRNRIECIHCGISLALYNGYHILFLIAHLCYLDGCPVRPRFIVNTDSLYQ